MENYEIVHLDNEVKIVSDILADESPHQYMTRIMKHEYDTDQYDNFNPVKFFDGYNYDEWLIPPMEQIVVGSSSMRCLFKDGKISQVVITIDKSGVMNNEVVQRTWNSVPSSIDELIIHYNNSMFVNMLHNGTYVHDVLKKDKYIKTIGYSLYYYGAMLEYMGILTDESKRMTSKDVILGLLDIPMFIANPNVNGEYMNIRPYNNLALFELIGLPFELKVDIPPTEPFFSFWLGACQHMIKVGESNNYIRRFFGEIHYMQHVTYKVVNHKVASMCIIRSMLGNKYIDFIYDGQVRLMKFINDDVSFTYVIDNGIGIRDHIADILDVPNQPIDVPTYTGKNKYIYAKITSNTCIPDSAILSSGLKCVRNNDYQPFWDSYGVQIEEDMKILSNILNETL